MRERNLWKMASAVFVITLGVVLMGGGLVANAGDYSSHHSGDWYRDHVAVYADTVQGHTNVGGPSICTLNNQFLRLQTIVWRIRVLDEYGNFLDNNDLKRVYVKLEDGTEVKLEAEYGDHPFPPPATDSYWTADWEIPADYPTGSLNYTVVAITNSYHKATFQPFNVASSQITILGSPPPQPPPE